MKRWHHFGIAFSPVLDADSVAVLSSIGEFSVVVPLLAASPMADNRRSGVAPLLDIERILEEAQHRWLRPAEICEILRNYHKFCIAPEPPNKPTSGSLFPFDRKVLRYFRKDGHNWRKKKDGKAVKEAHEKL